MAAGFNIPVNVFVLPSSLRQATRQTSNALANAFNSAQPKQFNQALGRITSNVSEFNKSLDAATARVFAFGATVAVLNAIRQAFSALVQNTIEVSQKLLEVQVVLGGTQTEFEKLKDSIFEVAKDTGQTFSTVAEGAAELARQGLSAAENAERLRAALVLTNISGIDSVKSIQTLTATLNGFSDASLTAEEVVNKLTAVDTAFAVSAGDLADGLARAGSTAQDAGVSFEELTALVTAVQERTARGGAVIGNAFKSIFTRLSRSTTIDELQRLGVEIDATQDGVTKLVALSNALDEITDPTIASKIKELAGGVFQINVVSSTLRDIGNDTSVFREAIETAANAGTEGFDKNARLVEGLSAQINKLVVEFTKLGNVVGNIVLAPLIGDAVKFAEGIGEGLNTILNQQGDGIGSRFATSVLNAFRNVIIGPGTILVVGGFLKIFRLVVGFAKEGFKEVFKIGSQTERIKLLENELISLLQQDARLRRTLLSSTTTQAQKEQAVLKAISDQNILLAQQRALVQSISNIAQKAGIRNFNPATGGFQTKAAGHQVESAMEVATARALGARGPLKAHLSKGTIGGRKFIMNSQETEIPRFSSNGDSAVIPHYAKGYVKKSRLRSMYPTGAVPRLPFNNPTLNKEIRGLARAYAKGVLNQEGLNSAIKRMILANGRLVGLRERQITAATQALAIELKSRREGLRLARVRAKRTQVLDRLNKASQNVAGRAAFALGTQFAIDSVAQKKITQSGSKAAQEIDKLQQNIDKLTESIQKAKEAAQQSGEEADVSGQEAQIKKLRDKIEEVNQVREKEVNYITQLSTAGFLLVGFLPEVIKGFASIAKRLPALASTIISFFGSKGGLAVGIAAALGTAITLILNKINRDLQDRIEAIEKTSSIEAAQIRQNRAGQELARSFRRGFNRTGGASTLETANAFSRFRLGAEGFSDPKLNKDINEFRKAISRGGLTSEEFEKRLSQLTKRLEEAAFQLSPEQFADRREARERTRILQEFTNRISPVIGELRTFNDEVKRASEGLARLSTVTVSGANERTATFTNLLESQQRALSSLAGRSEVSSLFGGTQFRDLVAERLRSGRSGGLSGQDSRLAARLTEQASRVEFGKEILDAFVSGGEKGIEEILKPYFDIGSDAGKNFFDEVVSAAKEFRDGAFDAAKILVNEQTRLQDLFRQNQEDLSKSLLEIPDRIKEVLEGPDVDIFGISQQLGQASNFARGGDFLSVARILSEIRPQFNDPEQFRTLARSAGLTDQDIARAEQAAFLSKIPTELAKEFGRLFTDFDRLPQEIQRFVDIVQGGNLEQLGTAIDGLNRFLDNANINRLPTEARNRAEELREALLRITRPRTTTSGGEVGDTTTSTFDIQTFIQGSISGLVEAKDELVQQYNLVSEALRTQVSALGSEQFAQEIINYRSSLRLATDSFDRLTELTNGIAIDLESFERRLSRLEGS